MRAREKFILQIGLLHHFLPQMILYHKLLAVGLSLSKVSFSGGARSILLVIGHLQTYFDFCFKKYEHDLTYIHSKIAIWPFLKTPAGIFLVDGPFRVSVHCKHMGVLCKAIKTCTRARENTFWPNEVRCVKFEGGLNGLKLCLQQNELS